MNDANRWSAADIATQQGRTVLVTGSNAGIGFATARLLAAKGARVVMACRSTQKGEAALTRIRSEFPGSELQLLTLDLADLESVRRFATQMLTQHERLDVLINNAGVMMPPMGRTADGFETQFGTNVLGHFALTGLLLPLLVRTPASRVVTLASVAHWAGRIDFDNLNAEKGYRSWGAYAQSKLANLMLAYELERRLRRAGNSTTISLAAHPGGTNSDLGRHNLLLRAMSPFAQSIDAGALPSLRAALDAAAGGGDYYGPAGLATLSGPPVKQRSSRRSHDEAVAVRLWARCQQLSQVSYL